MFGSRPALGLTGLCLAIYLLNYLEAINAGNI